MHDGREKKRGTKETPRIKAMKHSGEKLSRGEKAREGMRGLARASEGGVFQRRGEIRWRERERESISPGWWWAEEMKDLGRARGGERKSERAPVEIYDRR